jgi:hypothetical protein
LQKRVKGVKGFVFENNRIEKNDRQQKNKCQWQVFSPLPSCFEVGSQPLPPILPNLKPAISAVNASLFYMSRQLISTGRFIKPGGEQSFALARRYTFNAKYGIIRSQRIGQ